MKSRNFIPFNIYRKRSGKYKNILTKVDGIQFDSKLEAGYYQQLKIEKRSGIIKSFERQVSFDLYAFCPETTSGSRVCSHIVDFLVTLPDGSSEARECKGFATAVWDLKRKLFEANYPKIPYKVIR